MICGVSKKEERIIKGILKQYPYDFYYFGSRVKGNYTQSSDLDILIKNNKEISEELLEELDIKFNETILPYKINFSVYSNISNDFFNLIKDDLVKISYN